MGKASSRQQQVGEREAVYSHHSLNMHWDQLRGTGREKSSAHTQPRGPTSQLLQPSARSSRRDQRTRLGTSAALVPGRPFPREVQHSSPRARGPDTALVPPPPTPRPRKRWESTQRQAGLYPPSPLPNAVTRPRTHRGNDSPCPSRQEKPRAAGGGASRKREAAQQLRQVSSSRTLLLQPVAANTRAPPASVKLLRCSPLRLLWNFTGFLREEQPPLLSSPEPAVSNPDGAGGERQEASEAESARGGEELGQRLGRRERGRRQRGGGGGVGVGRKWTTEHARGPAHFAARAPAPESSQGTPTRAPAQRGVLRSRKRKIPSIEVGICETNGGVWCVLSQRFSVH